MVFFEIRLTEVDLEQEKSVVVGGRLRRTDLFRDNSVSEMSEKAK